MRRSAFAQVPGPEFAAVISSQSKIREIVLSSYIASDHMPLRVLSALEQLVKSLSEEAKSADVVPERT